MSLIWRSSCRCSAAIVAVAARAFSFPTWIAAAMSVVPLYFHDTYGGRSHSFSIWRSTPHISRLKHAGRYLYRSLVPFLLETAPAHRMPMLDDYLVHRDRTTEPRMPRVKHFPRLGTMGVALSTCIMHRGHICRSRKTRRRHDACRLLRKATSSHSRKSAACTTGTSVAPPDRTPSHTWMLRQARHALP
jgi:hypothetical protein